MALLEHDRAALHVFVPARTHDRPLGLGGRYQAADATQVVFEPRDGRFAVHGAGASASAGPRRAAAGVLIGALLLTACSDQGSRTELPAGAPEPVAAEPATQYPAEAAPPPAMPTQAPQAALEHDPGVRITDDRAAAQADPAMLRYVANVPAAHAARRIADAVTASDDAQGDMLRVDADRDQVFLPGMGWRDVEQVRVLYADRPQELPQDIDLMRLHHIMASLESSSRCRAEESVDVCTQR
jgi:hypothetical protein